jgi:hypothetical protein
MSTPLSEFIEPAPHRTGQGKLVDMTFSTKANENMPERDPVRAGAPWVILSSVGQL